MPWMINWDNGASAAGTFPWKFETEEEAKVYGDNLAEDNIAEGVWEPEGYCEPVWVPEVSSDSTDAEVEQSLDYFDRYIAGDR